MNTPTTPAQTIGPYWHLLDDPALADLTRLAPAGERIVLTGRISDGDGAPVSDACVEIWQASPAADDRFPGWGRCASDAQGGFHFTTLKPGALAGCGNTQQAPHIALTILARGIITRLVTRAYFAGEARNATDPVLGLLDDPARRATLLAQPAGPGIWRLDIRLQGAGETVFLDV